MTTKGIHYDPPLRTPPQKKKPCDPQIFSRKGIFIIIIILKQVDWYLCAITLLWMDWCSWTFDQSRISDHFSSLIEHLFNLGAYPQA